MKANRTVIGLCVALGVAGAVLAGWWVLGTDPGKETVDEGGRPPVLRGLDPDRLPGDPDGAQVDDGADADSAADPDDESDLDREPFGEVGGEASYEDILKAMQANDWKAVERFMRMGGGNSDPRVTDLLVKALENGRFRNWAAELAQYLRDPGAMGKFLEVATGDVDDQTKAAAILGAAQLSVHQGGTGLESVASDLLRGAKPGGYLMSGAARALAAVGTEAAARTLVDVLRLTHGRANQAIIEALGEIRDETTLATLGRLTAEEGDANLRKALVDALGRSRNPAVEADLLSIRRGDADPDVRLAALGALGMMNTASATEELIGVLKGGEAMESQAAARALASNPTAVTAPAIIEALEKGVDGQSRAYLLDALGRSGYSGAVGPLGDVAMNADEDQGLRVTAARGLGDLRTRKSMEPLLDLLENTSPQEARLFRTTIQSIGKVGNKSDIPALKKVLEKVPEQSVEHLMLQGTIDALERGPIVPLKGGVVPAKPR